MARPNTTLVLSLLAASTFVLSFAASAPAQDTPPAPTDTPSTPPAESPPPPEPAPPPPPPPPVVLPEEPPPASPPAPPPPKPRPKDLPPTSVTLEETPEEPTGAKPPGQGGARRATKPQAARRPPKPEATQLEEKPAAVAAEEPSEPAAAAKPSEDQQPEDKSKKEDDGEGLLGPFRIGVLVGTGLPSIVSFGGIIKLTRYFGAGLNVGLIPSIKLSLYGEADLSYQEYDLYGRLFPFGGALFVGAGVGYASVAGSFKSSYDVSAFQTAGVTLPNPFYIGSEASIRTLVLIPTIGLLHTFGSGFTIGVDLGAQIPIAPSETHFETVLPVVPPPQIYNQYVAPSDQKVRDTLDTVGRTVLPTLNLRIGWLI